MSPLPGGGNLVPVTIHPGSPGDYPRKAARIGPVDDENDRHAHREAVRVAVAGVAVYLVLGAALLAANDRRVEWFVKFGEGAPYTPIARQLLGDDLLVPLDDGHDGAAFWLLAGDPLLLDNGPGGRTEVTHFERPGYRAQRILYPVLASPGALFGEWGLVWALVAANLAVIGAGGYLTTRLALEVGAPTRAGWAFAANPLVLLSFVMDFADALALALLVAVVLALRRGRTAWSVAAAVATVLAKEIGLAAVAVLTVAPPSWGGCTLTRRDRAALLGLPTLAVVAWGAYARWRLGWPPGDVQELVVVPFAGFVDSWRRGWSWAGNWGDAFGAALVVLAAVVVAWRWWRRRSPELLAALPFALLVPFMSIYVVNLLVNLVRVIGPALTLVVIDWYAVTPSTTGRSRPARSPHSGACGRYTPPDRAGSAAG